MRVEDATLVPEGGVARLVLSRLDRMEAVADAVASAGGQAHLRAGRLAVVSTPSRLADASGRAGGVELARLVENAVREAVAAWLSRAPDVGTPRGALPCSRRPVVMGIVNVTPDSFSDGGRHYDPETHPGPAVDHGLRLADEGADVIDVGGESTRPGAEPVPEDEELRRVVPVVKGLASAGHLVSIDTTKAAVARRAADAGAVLINDISAGVLDPQMLATVADLGLPYIAMHMAGTPQTMQDDPRYADVVAEVFDFLADALDRAEQAGIPRDAVIVDPGIGFGKTVAHNLDLLRRIREFTSLGRPVMVGTSRKSVIAAVGGDDPPDDRLVGSLVTASHAVVAGASMVRVHDVAETVRAMPIARALAPEGSWQDDAGG